MFPQLTSDQGDRSRCWQGRSRDQATVTGLLELLEVERRIQNLHNCWPWRLRVSGVRRPWPAWRWARSWWGDPAGPGWSSGRVWPGRPSPVSPSTLPQSSRTSLDWTGLDWTGLHSLVCQLFSQLVSQSASQSSQFQSWVYTVYCVYSNKCVGGGQVK